jgi:hypothetical protein
METQLNQVFAIGMKVLDQIRRASFWGRYWSLLTALVLPVLVFFFLDYQNTRMLVSVVCSVLLAHAWRMQIRASHSLWHSLLWTSIVLLPMLGAIWLGLNVVRGNLSDYVEDYRRHLGYYRLYWYAVEAQDWIVWVARIDILLCLMLAVATVFKRGEARARRDELV